MTPKKKPSDMTTKQIANKIFPPEVRKELERVAHEKDQPKKKKK
ncbi:MAG: hypothetical protein R3B95_06150 [Nitrospirales bacterium]